jgi:hypothetical protein
MPNQSIHPGTKPNGSDASTTPSETEQLKDQLDSLADEIGKANWKDGAALKPRSGYSYDVVER